MLHLDVSIVAQNMDRLRFRDFATGKQGTLFALLNLTQCSKKEKNKKKKNMKTNFAQSTFMLVCFCIFALITEPNCLSNYLHITEPLLILFQAGRKEK